MADTTSGANALTFPFDSHAVRVVLRDGEPWFIAADVCAALDIGNNRQAMTRLDDDERGVISTDTPFGTQQMGVVNESGLYSLILGSRKPEAKRFKKWVTSQVLPAIRRTGAYSDPGATQAAMTTNPRVQYIADLARAGCLPTAALADLAYRMAPGMPAAAPPTRAPSAPPVPALAADYATAEALAPRVGMTAKRLNNLLSRSRWQTWQPDGGWFPTRAGSARALVGTGGIQWSTAAVQELVAAEADHAASLF